MSRYKLLIEYDGEPFMGWQRQKHGPSVQGALETALSNVDECDVTVFGAGRTDAGVHAFGQVAHVDLIKDIRPDKLRDAANFHLGDHTISVLDVESVDEEFHARFDAIYRRYLYRIIGRRPRLALDRNRVWRVPQALNADLMQQAALSLIGEHDFTTFRDTQCQAKSPIKTLDALVVKQVGDEVHVEVGARSFLHRQVSPI